MTAIATGGVTRFRKANRCPICDGGDDMQRGQGKRCSGYLSSDGRFAYCTREEHAGQAALEATDPPSYRHILEGECRCGVTHNPARDHPDEILATYDYLDTDGTLLYQVVRKAGKKFLQRRPDGNGGWIWKLDDTRRVLYRLPRVLETAIAGGTIYVVEGEKDVHAIEKTGATATTSPGGWGKWHSEYADALKGATVIIVADNDEPGIKHAHQVAQTLPAVTTTIVRAAVGKDAHDHLGAGLTLADFVPLEQATATSQTDAPKPIIFETLRNFLKRDIPKSEALVGVTRNGTNLLPRYGWVMPWGKEGSGKTSIIVDLLFHAAAGIPWLHYPIERPLKIVAIINEGVPGGLQDKLQQKTEVWHGDTDKVLDNLAIYASPWGEFTFKNDQAVEHAHDYIRDFEADYVAMDPLHTLGTTGAGTPQETEDFKHVLRKFGLWDDLGIITAHHSNKGGMVSGDWARHPDTVLRFEKEGKNPATRVTLEKARPADPHEIGVPQLLEWQTETLGYRVVSLDRETVTDDELVTRIREALDNADTPTTLTGLQAAVTGDNKRIAALAKAEVKAGRIGDKSTRSDRFLLFLPSHPVSYDTDNTDKDTNDAQTRISTDNLSGVPPDTDNTDRPEEPETAAVVGGVPCPLKGDATPNTDDGPTDPGSDLPTPTDEPYFPDDEYDRLAALVTIDPDPADEFGGEPNDLEDADEFS